MKERYGARDPRSMMLRTHAQTAGVSLTAQQPVNNVARVALQALAAVLGGVQSLHTNSMDETLSLPTEEAVKVALRTQQIIAEETGVVNTVDPLGGSFYLEQLTDDIEREALAYIAKIDEFGGMLRAVQLGYPQHEIAEAAYQFQLRLERLDEVQVGVNKFVDAEEELSIPTHQIDPSIERDQKERLVRFKAARNATTHTAALERLEQVCRDRGNVIEPLVDAVDTGVTLGEASEVFRSVFGEYRDPGLV
jgi:methylmalonyl-CoA mutase N-terminal domain/subunit